MALKIKENEQLVKRLAATGYYKLNVSRKNKKLVPNDTTDFIIWNIPAIKTCPFRTKECELACYARKAEKAYPTCLPSRENNFNESLKDSFVFNMVYTILSIRKTSRKDNIVVRIHESGDFYNKVYAEKWLRIMDYCKGENIQFIAYTKSYPYFDNVKLANNFSLRFSIWNDTTENALNTCKANNWNIYTAVKSFSDNDTFTQCRCRDCASCGYCWNNLYKDICCEIH